MGKHDRRRGGPPKYQNAKASFHRGSHNQTNSRIESEADRICATIPRLGSSTSLSEQMEQVYEMLALSDSDHDTRRQFIRKLEEKCAHALRNNCRFCYLYAFGSSVNTLGMKNCDLDLVLITNGEINTLWSEPLPNTLGLLTAVKNMMYREQSHFGITDIVPIRKARVPLLKFRHTHSNINCDVSFNRRMGVLNSRLISHVMQFSECAKLLAFTVRLWGKQKGFVGGGGSKINSYSMTLMVIFYLQHDGVLPPLKLLKHSANTIDDPREGASFFTTMADFERFKYKMECYSESELLTGFLTFYIKFRFEENIISVYEGRPLALTECPGFNEMLINVQDPFERNFNTTKGVREPMKSWFKKCLVLAWAHRAVLCHPSHNGEPWGLQYLLQPVDSSSPQKPGSKRRLGEIDDSYASSMADYDSHNGRTFTLDIPQRQHADPITAYTEYCVELARALKSQYFMHVELQKAPHPLSDAIRQSLGLSKDSSHGPQAKRQRGASTSSSQSGYDAGQVRYVRGGTVPVDYYLPCTVQLQNRCPQLRDTSRLHKDVFSYEQYFKDLSANLKKSPSGYAVYFTLSFQPRDGRFDRVEVEVNDVNTGYVESLSYHLRTVLPMIVEKETGDILDIW